MTDFLALFATRDHGAAMAARPWHAAVAALPRLPGEAIHQHTVADFHIAHTGAAACLRQAGPVTRLDAGRLDLLAPSETGTAPDLGGGEPGGSVVFDAASQRMTVASDHFGARQLYLLRTDHGWVVSTRLASVAPFATARRLDRRALREVLLQRSGITEHGLLEGVERLAPAHVYTFSADGTGSASCVWQMQYAPGEATSFDVMARTLRAAMDHALSPLARTSSVPAVLLSGGVDSSVVAAIAREHFAGVRCYVAVLDSDADDVELGRARFVAARLGLPLTEVPLDTSRLARDLRRITDLIEAPPRNPNNLVLAQLYHAMAGDGVDVALTGDGAEMMIGLGDTEDVQDFGRKHARVARLLPAAVRVPLARWLRANGTLLGWRLGRLLDEDEVDWALGIDDIEYRPPLRNLVWAQVKQSPAPYAHPCRPYFSGHGDFDDAMHVLAVETTLRCTLARHQALAPGFGVRPFTPFVHPAVVEFSRLLPRAMRRTDRSRPVLKMLCDQLVHEDVARWPKLGFPVPWKRWLGTHLAVAVGAEGDYRALAPALPPGFAAHAFRTNDGEALWTLMTLRLVMESLALSV